MKAIKKVAGALYRAKMRLKGVKPMKSIAKRMSKNRFMWKEARGRAFMPSSSYVIKDMPFLSSLLKSSKKSNTIRQRAVALKIMGLRVGD